MATEPDALLRSLRALEAIRPAKPLEGSFVLLEDGEIITDPISGMSYCTRAGWEALKAKTLQAGAQDER